MSHGVLRFDRELTSSLNACGECSKGEASARMCVCVCVCVCVLVDYFVVSGGGQLDYLARLILVKFLGC